MSVLSEQLAELHDEMDRFAQQLSAAAAAGPVIGSDGSGTVTVTVVAGRVDDVVVRSDWRDHVAATDLGYAVTAALTAAGTASLTRWVEAVAAQADEPAPRPRPMPRPTVPPAEADAATPWGDQLLAMVEAVSTGIDQVSAHMAAAAAATYTGHGAGGRAWVAITGAGQVCGVGYDRRWLVNAHGISIGRETTQAFHAAYDQLPKETVADMVGRSPLGGMARG